MQKQNNNTQNFNQPQSNNSKQNKPAREKHVQFDKSTYENVIDPYKYMEEFIEHREVKVIDFEIPFSQNFILYDLSPNTKGPEQDNMYLNDYFIRKHIRRGNTVIQDLNQDGTANSTYWGRKGLQKFFDLYREHLESNINKKELTSAGNKNVSESKNVHSAIFDDIIESLSQNSSSSASTRSIQVIKMEKANGQNAQVSYFRPLNSWIVASQNVSIAVRNVDDIEQYNKDRFQFARLIAQTWFAILEQLQQTSGPQFLDKLKEDMQGYTLVGEYVGNQDFQHLVQYTSIDIRFFSLVQHDEPDTCIDPLQAIDWLQSYGFTTVNVQTVGNFNNFIELNESLLKLYDQVSSADIEDEFEGGILYFVEKVSSTGKNTVPNRVLSLCQLKTIEYRIYRQLREKLRNFLNKNSGSQGSFIERFIKETKDLCQSNKPPRPLEFYMNVAENAFDFAEKYKNDQVAEIIHDEYLTFLNVVFYCMSIEKPIDNTYFTDNWRKKLLGIDWKSYKFDEKLDLSSKSTAPVAVKSINSGSNNVTTIYVTKNQPVVNDSKDISEVVYLAQENVKNVLIIVPIGIPGMGKSTVFSKFDSLVDSTNVEIFRVSSDEIREEQMKEERKKLMRSDKKIDDQTLFDNTRQAANKRFESTLQFNLSTNVKMSSASLVIILIDKNHPPNSIPQTIDNIRAVISEFSTSTLRYKIAALLPTCLEKYSFTSNNKEYRYPFSLNFILNCINRVQKRKNHPTLKGNGPASLQTLSMFINLYKDVDLGEISIIQNGFDLCLSYPYNVENSETKNFFGSNVEESLQLMLISVVGQDGCHNIQVNSKLDNALKEVTKQYPNLSEQSQNEQIRFLLQKALENIYQGQSQALDKAINKYIQKDLEEIQNPVNLPQKTPVKTEVVEEVKMIKIQAPPATPILTPTVSTVVPAVSEDNKTKPVNVTNNPPANNSVVVKNKEPSKEVVKETPVQVVATQVEQTKKIEAVVSYKYVVLGVNPQFPAQLRRTTKRKPAKPFNPKSTPEYLGIFADNQLKVQSTLLQRVHQNLQVLSTQYRDDNAILERTNFEINNLVKNNGKLVDANAPKQAWRPVENPHITTLYIGNRKDAKKLQTSDYYTNFEEGIRVPVQINAYVVVPDCIITGVSIVDPNQFEVENSVAHVTILVAQWQAVQSNNVLNALFSLENSPLAGLYQSGFFEEDYNRMVAQFQLEIPNKGNKKIPVYVIKSETFEFEGISQAIIKTQ